MNIINRITQLYLTELPKCPTMLAQGEAEKYFERLMMNGNIITYVQDGELLGFLEWWAITPEQFGRVCLNIPINHQEDLLNGEICLITRMWIIPDLRNAQTFISLGTQLLRKNMTATHYVALQYHKHWKPIQVYTRSEILKHYKIKDG